MVKHSRRGASLVREAALLFAGEGGIGSVLGRIEPRGDGLFVVFKGHGEQDNHDVRISIWQRFPGWKDAIGDAVILNAAKANVRTAATRRGFAHRLQSGLAGFLRDTGRHDTRPEDFDGATVSAFIGWLNRVEGATAVLKEHVRASYYDAVISMLDLLRSDPRNRHSILPATSIPANPWPNAQHSVRGTRELSEADLRAIASKTAALVRASSAEIEHLLSPASAATDFGDLAALLRARMVAGEPTTLTHLEKHDRATWRRLAAVDTSLLYRVIQPSLADLMPFIVMLAIATRYNQMTIVNTRIQDIARKDWIGTRRVVIRSVKVRPKPRRQPVSVAESDDAINPWRIFDLVRRWTSHIRSIAPSDSLFYYWKKDKGAGGAARLSPADPRVVQIMNDGYRDYAQRHDLPRFTIEQIRHAMLAIAHRLSGGDILKVRAAGGQRSLTVVADHYVTPAGRAREDEQLASAMRKHVAHGVSGGAYSPARMRGGSDACTPGWYCSRPSSGPYKGIDGQCVAIGMCAACEHGSIDTGSPDAFANVLRLLDAIDRSEATMSPEDWLDRLAPIRAHLAEVTIPSFSAAVRDLGASLSLPPLPTLD